MAPTYNPFRFNLLVKLGRILVPDYRFKWPQMEWWYDTWFTEYLERFGEREGMNTDRRWMLYQLMRLVENVPGDTVECGVYYGAASYLMLEMNSRSKMRDRLHHIFDSFEGLSPPGAADGDHWHSGALSVGEQIVEKNLETYSGAFKCYRGWIPDRFPEIGNRAFSFVHVDVDLLQPTSDSIKFFYPRLSPGGILLCDDYGFTTCPGATSSCDEFLADKPEKMIALSAGGGFLIKGLSTASRI